MSPTRLAALTVLAMLAFAGNSLLCRAALQHTPIDAATFTTVRLVAGAVALWLLVALRRKQAWRAGNWLSAVALFVYAAGFSYAYLSLPAATGALLLFGAVQATMIGHAWLKGERLAPAQLGGMGLAFGGLAGLLMPGMSAPPMAGAALMLAAGAAWGIYSLRGRGGGNPIEITAGNFLRAAPMALLLSAVAWEHAAWSSAGLGYAAASGALASGMGYALWYTALPGLRATQAATVQLSVPVLAAFGAVLLLDEAATLRLVLASVAILGGIALVIWNKRKP
ncbi:DMT family transporter [Acidovorax soli]|uniref:EamA-like transporter family protein n=1 Tax=Acidovorax soli TaxID=592050 RepID=A0A1H3XK72_9BURK|nr:DMT family transporter [Acidovorax soli]SDZ99817.1 EamA-like transporter family protein [Acidovorax soli]